MGQERHCLGPHAADVRCLAFSSDGSRLVSGDSEGWLRLWDVETGELLNCIDQTPVAVPGVVFLHEGNYVATPGARKLRIWNLQERATRLSFHYWGTPVPGPPFSSLDGKYAGVVSHDGTITIRCLADPCGSLLIPNSNLAILQAAVSPNGRFIACIGQRFERGASEQTSQKGTQIFWSTMIVWDTAVRPPAIILDRQLEADAIRFSPSGDQLAVASWMNAPEHGGVGRIDIFSCDTWSRNAHLYHHGGRIYGLAISQDGTRLAHGTMGGSICVWDIQRNEEVLWLHGHHGPIRDLAFSFDGTDLMSSSSVEATTRIWDLRTSSCRDILSGVVDPATVFSRIDRSTFWPVGHPG
jgi:WD40 repeat protein